MPRPKAIRCAIYTRKSSEEGLDQSFNSLDAQREAGEAYVKSQAHEGWVCIPTLYDDGGYSGGSMERPALRQLLSDVDAGLVDVVVVYKIDRLTRSLPDFARIVEKFDARQASFVSVTQAFSTTTSMGRLTLNVLLSFAQFEREVTGERIRDKIAASKAKGMWMGGNVPLGYDLPSSGTRVLEINEDEAATVRQIFDRYLELGSVHALQRDLVDKGVVSKRRITRTGRVWGGCSFNRGALFHLLSNPIYVGRIRHKDVIHDGIHKPIISNELFHRVQQRLETQAPRKRATCTGRFERSALTGKLFDAAGEPMGPTFSRGSKGSFYRYYVSASLQRGALPPGDEIIRRVAAPDIEKAVISFVSRWVPTAPAPLQLPLAVYLRADGLLIDLPGNLFRQIAVSLSDGEHIIDATRQSVHIHVRLALPLRGGKRTVVAGSPRTAHPDPKLIGALRKAHAMLEHPRGMPLISASPASIYERKILRLAFLAPDLQRDILMGHQPSSLHLEKLRHIDIPLCWKQQRDALGWHTEA